MYGCFLHPKGCSWMPAECFHHFRVFLLAAASGGGTDANKQLHKTQEGRFVIIRINVGGGGGGGGMQPGVGPSGRGRFRGGGKAKVSDVARSHLACPPAPPPPPPML